MAVIKDYPEALSLANDDVFLIDTGVNGYKQVKKSTLINDIKTNAIDPVTADVITSIYDTCVSNGKTPRAKTIPACQSAINDIRLKSKVIDVVPWYSGTDSYVFDVVPTTKSYLFIADMIYTGSSVFPWALSSTWTAGCVSNSAIGSKTILNNHYYQTMEFTIKTAGTITIEMTNRAMFTDPSCRAMLLRFEL